MNKPNPASSQVDCGYFEARKPVWEEGAVEHHKVLCVKMQQCHVPLAVGPRDLKKDLNLH